MVRDVADELRRSQRRGALGAHGRDALGQPDSYGGGELGVRGELGEDEARERGGRYQRRVPPVPKEGLAKGLDEGLGPRVGGRVERARGLDDAGEAFDGGPLGRHRGGLLRDDQLRQRQREARGHEQAAEEGRVAEAGGEEGEEADGHILVCTLAARRRDVDQRPKVRVRRGVDLAGADGGRLRVRAG